MDIKTHSRLAAAGTLTAGLALTMTVPAQARGGGGVIHEGPCSMNSDWKLKAKHDDGRLEVEAEVDSNQVGQTWHYRILDNGSVADKGKKVTQAPSGSFEVHARIANAAGTDHIKFQAANRATGETCKGKVAL